MDPNPKPEVAIALTDDFTACFGFATTETLTANFEKSATLRSIVSECTEGKYEQCYSDNSEWLKDFVYGLFNSLEGNQERLVQVINGLREESEALEPELRSIH